MFPSPFPAPHSPLRSRRSRQIIGHFWFDRPTHGHDRLRCRHRWLRLWPGAGSAIVVFMALFLRPRFCVGSFGRDDVLMLIAPAFTGTATTIFPD